MGRIGNRKRFFVSVLFLLGFLLVTVLSERRPFLSRSVLQSRGGAFGQNDQGGDEEEEEEQPQLDNDATVEEYVAAMRERDDEDAAVAQTDGSGDDTSSSTTRLSKPEKGSITNNRETSNESEPSGVGLKSKKSNAVGDPDGDDDDDDDDTEEETEEESLEEETEYSEEWEEIEESYDHAELYEPQVEVEVELVEERVSVDRPRRKGAGGGVGVRLGRMANRRKHHHKKKTKVASNPSVDETRLLDAWNPFVYFPPSQSGLDFLSDHARLLDASSKNRLDRRTLYAGLLLEWGATNSKLSNSRRFLPVASSQALQAALSMATQPLWRLSAPRTNGIRLYHEHEASKACTLGMQETIAMALVRKTFVALLLILITT